jgi:HPr kinase/phosphorylase
MAEITNQITIENLYHVHGDKFDLAWVAGKDGNHNIIVPETARPNRTQAHGDNLEAEEFKNQAASGGKPLIGYLNLIHPHQIQIIGGVELNYIEGLRDITRHDAVKQLFKHDPACIIIADGERVPAFLKRKCNEKNVPLFTSSVSSTTLADSLHYYLANLFADLITLHGVFMEVMSIGVLITGPSGIGKSELALELISRGHRLIADDAPQFSRITPDIINGVCPEPLRDFLEVRGLGIINIRRLYGDTAIKNNKYLRLIVRLEPMSKEQMLKLDRLEGSYRTREILGVDIAEITLPVAPGRNLAILLECAARNYGLRMGGYNASEDFISQQQHTIDRQNSG